MAGMTDVKTAWDEVASRFAGLGLKFKYHFEQRRAEEETGEVKEALQRLGDALDDAFTAVGAAARDPAVHEDFKETGEALGKALSKTLNEVAAEVRKAFDRSPK